MLTLVLILLCLFLIPIVSADTIIVLEHSLGLGLDESDRITGEGLIFNSDDIVYSKIVFENIEEGDVVKWVYSGPDGLEVEDSLMMNFTGVAYTFAAIDMTEYEPESVTGTWAVRVDVNEVEVSIVIFEVILRPQGIPSFPILSSLIGTILFVYARADKKRQENITYQTN
jgi:hypothetical protein